MIAKEKSLVGFAIATFNRKHRLKECIDAINRSSYKNILICVTDDGSSDGTWEMLDMNSHTLRKQREMEICGGQNLQT